MSESFFDKLAMEQTEGGGMMVTMRDAPREKSGIPALDALTERPQRKGHGIMHSRKLGRVARWTLQAIRICSPRWHESLE